jgi:hypothetical protein
MSVPGVTGLFFDPLVDPQSDPAAPGLLAADLRPKRAYKVLRALFQHEWRAHVRGVTDAEGCFAWRGFHGSYEVTVIWQDGSHYSGRLTLEDTAAETTISPIDRGADTH